MLINRRELFVISINNSSISSSGWSVERARQAPHSEEIH